MVIKRTCQWTVIVLDGKSEHILHILNVADLGYPSEEIKWTIRLVDILLLR